MKYIGDEDFHPKERLREVLDTPSGLTPFAELDHLYHRILNASPDPKCLHQVLSVVSFMGLYVRDLELILQLPQGRARTAVRRARSILHNTDISLSFYHKTFREFLHNRERAGKFFIDSQGAQAFVAQKLLELLRFGVVTHHSDSVLPITPASSPTPTVGVDENPPLVVQIAEVYWCGCVAESGTCNKFPQLLQEISMTLDSSKYPLFNSNGFSYVVLGVISMFQWFTVGVCPRWQIFIRVFIDGSSPLIQIPNPIQLLANTILLKSNIDYSSTSGDNA